MNRMFLFCTLVTSTAMHGICLSEDISIQQLASGCQASFRGIKMVDPQTVLVSGSDSTVLLTQDGGTSWARLHVSESNELDFRDIESTGDGNLILMSAGLGEKSQILHSENLGQSWSVVYQNREATVFFNGMDFTKQGLGILTGDPVDGRLFLLRTTDSGKSWTPMAGPTLLSGEYGFAASGTGITLGDEGRIWIATGAAAARVFHSQNYGRSWAVATTPVRSGKASEGIFSVAFQGPGNGVIVGGDYKIPAKATRNCAFTSDGGVNWIAATTRMPHKACVRFLDDQRVLAVGRTGIMLSENRGVDWHTISNASFYTFDHHKESGTVFLAGADGNVAKLLLPTK